MVIATLKIPLIMSNWSNVTSDVHLGRVTFPYFLLFCDQNLNIEALIKDAVFLRDMLFKPNKGEDVYINIDILLSLQVPD